MLDFIFSQILFYISLILVLFLPGFFFARAINSKFGLFTKFEEVVFSVGFSIFFSDSLILMLGAMGIQITKWSILVSLIVFSSLCFVFEKTILKKKSVVKPQENLIFSKKQLLATCILLGLSLFIRTLYLNDTILPSATDMGHHMYWSNVIVQKGVIPNYQQGNVLTTSNPYQISQPQNISDFIIGEHLIFAAISLLSGLSIVSYFPALVLLVINIFSLLAVMILALRMFEKSKHSVNISILTLFLIGPIFAVAPPQAKFISGGVIGNIIGNLLLPLALYLFLRAMREKNNVLLTLAFVFSMSLFYTHHLTALIFLLSLFLGLFFVLLFNFKNSILIIKSWAKIFFTLPTLSFLFFAAAFAFLVYTPTYITNQAVKTVIGAPKKIEHTGLTITQFKDAIGEPRLVLAVLGIFILSYLLARKMQQSKNASSYKEIPFHLFILAGWVGIISVISLYPQLVKIGIPSGRVADYGLYPFSIIAAFSLNFLFFLKNRHKDSFAIKPSFFFSVFILIFLYLTASGFYDNGQNLSQGLTPQKINQTFNASEFLSKKIAGGEQVASDHIYIKADSWTKIFFMKDYNFPLYRANFERYENGVDRNERCTLTMISSPNTPDSQKCFSDLNVRYVMVSKNNDSAQFQKNPSFWQIYSNDEINIYYRNDKI